MTLVLIVVSYVGGIFVGALLATRNTTATAQASCPTDTADMSYILQGYKEDGKPLCTVNYIHECPYAHALSLTDPLCDKLAKEQAAPVATAPVVAPTETTSASGDNSCK